MLGNSNYTNRNVVLIILSDEQGYKALRYCSPHNDETPIRLLIKNYPDIAGWVLYKSELRDADQNKTDGSDPSTISIAITINLTLSARRLDRAVSYAHALIVTDLEMVGTFTMGHLTI